jgi:hypothetical protein
VKQTREWGRDEETVGTVFGVVVIAEVGELQDVRWSAREGMDGRRERWGFTPCTSNGP